MKETKELTIWKVISLILLILIVGGGVYFISNPLEMELAEEPKALVYTDFSSWGPELENNNNYIFQYFVYNFGNAEARDVIIQCVIIDQNDNVIKKVTKTFGNLASTSSEADEMYEYLPNSNSEYYAYCLTKSCSGNCEILEHNIPEVNKYL